jgi:hypothetical protein
VNGKISFNKVTTLSLSSGMGTRGYGYNQIRVRIHIIMGSQIPVDTRLAIRPVPVKDFTHKYPWA